MPEVKLTAELRTEFGKGAARRIRRAHKVPAVLYGHGTDPIHISLPGHETLLALRTANALLSIDVNGKSQLALPKQVQRDPLKHTIEHVDLVHRARRREGHRRHRRSRSRARPPRDTLVVVDQQQHLRSRPRPPTSRRRSSSRSRACPAGTQILASDLEPARGLDARHGARHADRQHHRRPDRPKPPRPSWPRPRPRPASSRRSRRRRHRTRQPPSPSRAEAPNA